MTRPTVLGGGGGGGAITMAARSRAHLPFSRYSHAKRDCVTTSQYYLDLLKFKTAQLLKSVRKKNSRSEDFLLAKHKHTNIPTMTEPFSPPVPWFWWRNIPHPREPLCMGLDKAAVEWFYQNQYDKGENNLFLLPLCKLQQSLICRRQW